jgi:hypothetical protein
LLFDKNNKRYFFNPILPAWFLKDYIRRYGKTKNNSFLHSAKILTNAILPKSTILTHDNLKARTIYYEPGDYVARAYAKHYSGLTNSLYASAFGDLYSITKDDQYLELCKEFINSLKIPISEGGVLFKNTKGLSIAEVPLRPHGLVLNGWLSTIAYLIDSNMVLKDKELEAFIMENVKTLENIIDLYDVEELRSSRYDLTQFYNFKLLNNNKDNLKIREIRFDYPSEEELSFTPRNILIRNKGNKFSRWQFYILKNESIEYNDNEFIVKKSLEFNGVLTRFGYPKTNKIVFACGCKGELCEVDFQVQIGDYSPLSASPVKRRWITLERNNIKVEGNRIEVNLPYEVIPFIGYPTNFLKQFKDNRRKRNVYHDIHIKWLRFIGNTYKREKLLKIADKWVRYKQSWKHMPEYRELFEKYDVITDYYFVD